MTERTRGTSGTKSATVGSGGGQARQPAAPRSHEPVHVRAGEEAERALGRAVAVGLPILSVVSALVVGFVASVGSGLLVLASGALIGTIALLWASVRTLSGDAPLPADLETLAAQNRDIDALAEEKRRVLRALKDIESEHALGKIDDEDYEVIARQYRASAKELMREMDRNAAPSLAEAERIAREYLAAQNLGESAKLDARRPRTSATGANENDAGSEPTGDGRERAFCASCATSNEPDAAFCKKCGGTMKPAVAQPVDESTDEAAKDNDATS